MKKILIMICIISMALLLLAGCSGDGQRQGKETAGTNTPWLHRLEVYSNAVNPEQIYHVTYPYGFYAFTSGRDGSGSTERFDLTDSIRIDELVQDENSFQYFIEYIKGLPEKQEGNALSYYIICGYTDEEGNEEYLFRRGYDTFPEGWDNFIDEYNRICGGEYLSGSDQIQTVTPEFLTEAFGVTILSLIN